MLKRGLRDYLVVAFPKIAGGGLMLLLNVWLMHVLDPAVLAVFTLCTTSIIVIDAILGTAIDVAVLRLVPIGIVQQAHSGPAVETAGVLAKLCVTLLLALVIIFAGDSLSDLVFHRPDLAGLMALTVCAAIGLLLLRSSQVHAQVTGSFGFYGLLETIHVVVKFGLAAILIAAAAARPSFLLAAFVIGPFCALAWGMRRTLRVWWQGRHGVVRALGELVSFAKWYLLSFAVGTVVSRLDLYMLAALSDLSQTGVFAAAMVVAMIPEMLGAYLGVVFYPRIMPLCAGKTFRPFFRRVQLWLIAVAIFVMLASLVLMKAALAAFLPVRYADAAPVAQVLLAGALAGMVAYPVLVPFLMFHRPRFILILDGVLLLPILLSYAVAIQSHGALGAAWVTAASRLLRTVIAQGFAQRLARDM